jgi:RimJ/RimL family protein N-acetyltransferase
MIETDRLLLRDWRSGDEALLDRYCNTESVMRWLGGVQPFEKVQDVVARLVSYREDYGHTFWAVERRADGAFLGFCGLKRANGFESTVAGEVEIGWRLREDAWGQGYAKEAALASLDFAFERIGARRVVALTIEENVASRGLMKRLGMRRRPDLDYSDPEWPASMNPIIVYELTREDWQDGRNHEESTSS